MRKLIVMGIVAAMVMGLGVAASAYTINANTTAHSASMVTVSSVNNNAPTAITNSPGDQTWFMLPGAAGSNTGTAGSLYYRMYKNPAPAVWTFKVFVENATTDPSLTVNVWGAAAAQITDLVGKTWALKNGTSVLASGTWTAAMIDSAHPVLTYTWASTANMVGEGAAMTVTLGEYVTDVITPEPGSILAVLTGLVGLIGIRRRK